MMLLKLERLRRGWSQSQLARRAGINASTVSQIESHRWQPYPSQLAKLALALGVPEAKAHRLLSDDASTRQVGLGA